MGYWGGIFFSGKSAEKIYFFCYGKFSGKNFSGKNNNFFLQQKINGKIQQKI